MKFYVAAVRDWDEERMMANPDNILELGTQKAFITTRYKTVTGLVIYCVQRHCLYYSNVWAVFRVLENRPDQFVGLEYNYHDEKLASLAGRYMRVRKRKGQHKSQTSGIPVGVRQ